jgi:hypothetical protein
MFLTCKIGFGIFDAIFLTLVVRLTGIETVGAAGTTGVGAFGCTVSSSLDDAESLEREKYLTILSV